MPRRSATVTAGRLRRVGVGADAAPLFTVKHFPERKLSRRWGVLQGQRWRFAMELSVNVPTILQDAGGVAVATGYGFVRCVRRGCLVITP